MVGAIKIVASLSKAERSFQSFSWRFPSIPSRTQSCVQDIFDKNVAERHFTFRAYMCNNKAGKILKVYQDFFFINTRHI